MNYNDKLLAVNLCSFFKEIVNNKMKKKKHIIIIYFHKWIGNENY